MGTFILHPFFFALYPVFSLLGRNIQEIPLAEVGRSCAVILITTVMLLAGLRLIVKNWFKAAALTSLCIILFFSYGHVYSLVKYFAIAGFIIGRHRFLLGIWVAAAIVGSWLILCRIRDQQTLTSCLNIFAVVSVLVPIYSIASFSLSNSNDWNIENEVHEEKLEGMHYECEGAPPDVYYIIMDAYARSDILRDRYGYDNSDFIEFLNKRGFYIAEHSNSNYIWTIFSLASSLNMNYIDDLGISIERNSIPSALYEPTKHSLVRIKLESMGYSTVGLATGWYATEFYDADVFLSPDMERLQVLRETGGLNRFESLLMYTSIIRPLMDLEQLNKIEWLAQRMNYTFRHQRATILAAFDNLSLIPSIDSPKFVFAHIVSPHSPYFFGPNGEDRHQEGAFSLKELEKSDPWGEEAAKYRGQLIYVTKRLEEAIDDILERSDERPIIIIQSDHGPGLGFDPANPEEATARDRVAILNAYLLPNGCDQYLYSTISPVNSFRVIFNCCFGEDYELIEDESYLNDPNGSSPQDFTPISELFK